LSAAQYVVKNLLTKLLFTDEVILIWVLETGTLLKAEKFDTLQFIRNEFLGQMSIANSIYPNIFLRNYYQ